VLPGCTNPRRTLQLTGTPTTPTRPVQNFEQVVLQNLHTITNTLEIISKRLDNYDNRLESMQVKLDRALANHPLDYDDVHMPNIQHIQQQPPPPQPAQSADLHVSSPFHIPYDDLRILFQVSRGAGNFAKKLVERLFPELFGPEQLRFNYSYYGRHGTNKLELDPARRKVIQSYVMQFYPQMTSHHNYQREVVNKINEGLRRPVQRKQQRQSLQDISSVFNYINL